MLILSTQMCFSQENSNTVLPPLGTMSHQISQETLFQMLCALQAILIRGRASQYNPNLALNPYFSKRKVSKSVHTHRGTGMSCPQSQLPVQPSLPSCSPSPCLQCWAGKMPPLCESREYLNPAQPAWGTGSCHGGNLGVTGALFLVVPMDDVDSSALPLFTQNT